MVQAVLYHDFNMLETLSNNMYIKPYVLLIKIDHSILKDVLRQPIPALIQKIFKSLK